MSNTGSVERSRHKLRLQMLKAYGGKCACCGETYYKLLTIDHIIPKQAQEHHKDNTTFYRSLRNAGWPAGYQVLCYNCNCNKRTSPSCDCQSKKTTVDEALNAIPLEGHHGFANDGITKYGGLINLVCKQCLIQFQRDSWSANRSRKSTGPYCSISCSVVAQRAREKATRV